MSKFSKFLILSVILVSIYWFLSPKQSSEVKPAKVTETKTIAKKEYLQHEVGNQDKLPIEPNRVTVSTQQLINDVYQKKLTPEDEKQQVTESKVKKVLENTPENYHVLFKSDEHISANRIEIYSEFISDKEIEPYNANIEKQIINYIYQHNMGNDIEINQVNCTSRQCEVLGIQKNSIAWITIQGDLLKEPWLSMSKVTDYQGHNSQGEMVFITLFSQ